jgi:nucleotide-binding universal stress UspA family protein
MDHVGPSHVDKCVNDRVACCLHRVMSGTRREVNVMFKKIVLPLDLSDRHRPAVDVAAELAKQSGGEVVLLHVIEIIPGVPLEDEKAFYSRLDKMARTHLEGVSRRLSERRVPCQTKVLYGHRAREVAGQAEALGADLIVLTAPQIDAAEPTGWGSLSWKIGVLCRCAVLLVKQDTA